MKRVSFNDALNYDDGILDISSEESDDNSELIERLKIVIKVIIEYGGLSSRQKQLLNLYYYENMRVKDIANKLNIHTSTVSKTIKRSRDKISKMIDDIRFLIGFEELIKNGVVY